MKAIVIYNSKTGFTKRYAQWIAQAAGADCLELSAAKKENLAPYEAIVFGGWACAGSISKLRWFKSNLDQWAGKKLIVFCVGASPIENPEIEPILKRNFSDSELEQVNLFYCPGGFNYENMSVPFQLIMKVFIQTLKAKKDKTETERQMVDVISSSYDLSDKKYIQPILQCLET